jgi:hypothetical protein
VEKLLQDHVSGIGTVMLLAEEEKEPSKLLEDKESESGNSNE